MCDENGLDTNKGDENEGSMKGGASVLFPLFAYST